MSWIETCPVGQKRSPRGVCVAKSSSSSLLSSSLSLLPLSLLLDCEPPLPTPLLTLFSFISSSPSRQPNLWSRPFCVRSEEARIDSRGSNRLGGESLRRPWLLSLPRRREGRIRVRQHPERSLVLRRMHLRWDLRKGLHFDYRFGRCFVPGGESFVFASLVRFHPRLICGPTC